MTNNKSSRGLFGGIIPFAILAVVLIGIFFLFSFVIKTLYFLAPLILIGVLIIDYKVAINYVKSVMELYKKNWIWGLGATAFTFVLYPVVFVVLLFRAVLSRQLGKMENFDDERGGKFAEYEEVDDEDVLDLDDLPEKEPELDKGNYYRDILDAD